MTEMIAVRTAEYIIKCVTFHGSVPAEYDGQQVEIVIAQDYLGSILQLVYEFERVQIVRAAINQVSEEPKLIGRSFEMDVIQEAAKVIVATLDITYRIRSHAFSIFKEIRHKAVGDFNITVNVNLISSMARWDGNSIPFNR